MNAFQQTGMIMGMVAVCASATWILRGEPQRVVACDATQLRNDEVCLDQILEKEGVLWIDARLRAQWQRDGYPGSVLWNLDPAENEQEMEAGVAMKLMEAQIAVVYCSDKACGTSKQIAERVRALGLISEVKILHGGWQSLADAGVVTDSN